MAKVLVIGSGGREHAIAAKFAQSTHVRQVYVAPGNPGMTDVAMCVNIGSTDIPHLIEFCKIEEIDLVFVGPEIPLCEGLVDEMQKANIQVFGPTKAAAMLEGSKVFCKEIMAKYDIPTAKYASFDNYADAKSYLDQQNGPIVVKADGLAAGKGVVVAMTNEEAQVALKEMMCDQIFASAGSNVVLEEYLEGEEFSQLAFVNGDVVVPMQIAQDHKRAFDNDEGLNTGGMGAYTPVSHLPQEAVNQAIELIVKPMAKAMVSEGKPFLGVLYAGCMWTADGVKTIEFNVRFGDPETEVLLQAMQSDLYEVCISVLKGEQVELTWHEETFVGVVLAAKGYPQSYEKNHIIEGLDEVETPLYHMGTALLEEKIVSNGGRVLFVSACGKDVKAAQEKVYHEINKIKCDGLFYRSDIGNKGK